MQRKQWQFFIDRGGTFTDIIAIAPNGQMLTHKLLSDNPAFYKDPILYGINKILQSNPEFNKKISILKMGTTLGTNAMLERKGAKVALAITRGFADALRIGYQNRPDLFALKIDLPRLMYETVIEIDERIDTKGHVLQKLNEKHAFSALQAVYAKGFRSLAIVLMHGFRYTQHEVKLKKIAEEIGFSHISVSHEVAPMMKLISRGDTTVLDAYLSPTLHNYLKQLQQNLGHTPLYIMQSNGRLVKATHFKGKDSILSGPAGGVVGMVKTSGLAGFKKVIGFDMGGTSTDVSHYQGDYERTVTCEISGVRIRTPMMLINSIAAGGGSILHFDGRKFTVGPDSASANPGPACYRKNGPLTITDCNVLLGKIQADFFPKVFGTTGQETIDVDIVRTKFAALRAGNDLRSLEAVAEGFIKIAVENMANAIKKISVERGYPLTDYVLNCFGAASGQHACLVADVLGIRTILIHPFAGVLSAFGIGQAHIGMMREYGIEKPLQECGLYKQLQSTFKRHLLSLHREMKKQRYDTKLINHKHVYLRYAETDTTLTVRFSSLAKMRKEFAHLHRQRFGFVSDKPLIVEAISIEVITAEKNAKKSTKHHYVTRREQPIPKLKTVKVFTHNAYHDAPIYDREILQPGDCIKGCAIIIEMNATTIVEPGWQAQVTKDKNIVMSRHKELPKRKTTFKSTKRADPVMLEIFNNRFMSIAEQMGEVLRNTACSVNIKERLDFSCALFDADGELIANAPHIPVHLGSMSESVKSIIKQNKKSLSRHDVFMLNAPYAGGTHLPDITVITPVFAANQLRFFVGSRGHHADIGGMTPGSMPALSHVIEEEGIVINNFKLVSHGRFLESKVRRLLTRAQYKARNVPQNIADLKAQIAANLSGAGRLYALIDEFGWPMVKAYMAHVRENATLTVQELLLKLPDGQFTYTLDNGSKIKASITINRKGKTAKIDFTGTALQHHGNFNAPPAITKAAVLYVLRLLVAKNIPLNGGCFLPLQIIIPQNSMLNPKYPAAVVAGNVETSQCIVDTLLGALGVMAASQGTCNNFTFGNSHYQYYETICGGSGAGINFHGTSAVHTHMTNTHLTDPEILEYRFPVILEDFKIRLASGGAGLYHGGDGVIRQIQFLEKMRANLITNHRVIPPYGLQGGYPGKVGKNCIKRANGQIEYLPSCADFELLPGDTVIIETPGGGGYGNLS